MFKLGNTEVNATAVTENYESMVPDQRARKDWVKPSTWLDPPANPNGDDVIYGILPVYDTDQEEVIITFYFGNNNDSSGSVDVDWGDGNVETFTAPNQSGIRALHKYNYSDINSNTQTTVFGRSCRQAIVKVTLNSSSNADLSGIYFNGMAEATYDNRDMYATPYSKWTEFYVNWSNLKHFHVGRSLQRNSIARYLHKVTIENNNLFSMRFEGSYSLVDLSIQDNGTLTSLNRAFASCSSLISIPDLDTSNVTDFLYALYYCTSLRTAPNWDTSSGTDFGAAFSNTGVSEFPAYNFSSATNVASCFSGNKGLKKGIMPYAPNATNFESVFNRCENMAVVRFLGSTAHITNFNYCFYYCFNLRRVAGLDTSGATSMSSAFHSCTLLKRLPYLNTPNLTNLSSTFAYCTHLQRVHLSSVDSVTAITECFNGCRYLKEIKIDSLNCTGVTNLYATFNGCASLEYLPEINTSNVTSFDYAVTYVKNLKKFPNWDFSSAIRFTGFFNFGNRGDANFYIEEIPDISAPNSTNAIALSSLRACKRVGNLSFPSATSNPNFYDMSSVEEWGELNVSGCQSPGSMFYGTTSVVPPMLILASGTNMGSWMTHQNVREIPAWNLSGVNINSCFENMRTLDSFLPTYVNTSISFNGTISMASGAIVQVINALASGVTGQTANFTNVSTASVIDFSDALSKGWTVTT
jgi:hypothetical protein